MKPSILAAIQSAISSGVVLATNTMHKVADRIVDGVSIPFLHIADATATAILDRNFRKPGLMATAFTMEQNFYTDRLAARGLLTIIPQADDRAETHRIIYEELCCDVVTKESRSMFESIAQRLIDEGCDCLILGCTEVGMLLNQDNVGVPVLLWFTARLRSMQLCNDIHLGVSLSEGQTI
jgi:aspartate racemase